MILSPSGRQGGRFLFLWPRCTGILADVEVLLGQLRLLQLVCCISGICALTRQLNASGMIQSIRLFLVGEVALMSGIYRGILAELR